MRGFIACIATVLACAGTAVADGNATWSGYLDYAYVYSSAEPEALRARLTEYGREAGMSLEDHVARHLDRPPEEGAPLDENAVRRRAIANLLLYLSKGEPAPLEASVEAISQLEDRLSRHENRYWFHYILAHRALEKGQRFDFVGELLELWLRVVTPLESPYNALDTLSLSESPSSGFVAALPYLYENVARLVLIKGTRMGVNRDLDPLGALVRMLNDGRVGTHPDVIPVAASSRDYLDRIETRLSGPESDGGSLTFTLALFEASALHEKARGLLATQGLDDETLAAIRAASAAYELAINRARTVQGRCAVYTRVLRQLGEVYAAKRRLDVDAEIQTPFSIEGAIEVYDTLHEGREEGRWADLGYRNNGRQAWVDAMHGLWEEIQEATLNTADYYVGLAIDQPHQADEHLRNAARIQARYLAFFHEFASGEAAELVPDSAYFAAYESARGFGDAFLAYPESRPTPAEMQLATRRYLSAMKLFPFDRELWATLTAALERQGRESEYMELVRPVAERVARSRQVDGWIENGEPGAQEIAALRRALADSLALLHLGFADAAGIGELEEGLLGLHSRRDEIEQQITGLRRERSALARGEGPIPAAPDDTALPSADDDLPDVSAGGDAGIRNTSAADLARLAELDRAIEDAGARLARVERQIAARERALPLFKATLDTTGLIDDMRARRDHPAHTLLRRMYHEKGA